MIETDEQRALLAEMVATFEAHFAEVSDEIGFLCGYEGSSVHDGRDWSHAPNGIRYFPVTNGGLKLEGASQPWRFVENMPDACAKWLQYAWDLSKVVTGVAPYILYWRLRPEIEIDDDGKVAIYSRFAVGRQDDAAA